MAEEDFIVHRHELPEWLRQKLTVLENYGLHPKKSARTRCDNPRCRKRQSHGKIALALTVRKGSIDFRPFHFNLLFCSDGCKETVRKALLPIKKQI